MIGKSVKQAAFLPLYTAPDRCVFKNSIVFKSFLKLSDSFLIVFTSLQLFWKHAAPFWTSIFVCKISILMGFGQPQPLSMTLPCWSFHRWNDKKAKMHYVLFCMPEISPSKLYLLRKGTDVNRYRCWVAGVTYTFTNTSIHVFLCVCADVHPAASCPLTSVTTLTVQMRIILQLCEYL